MAKRTTGKTGTRPDVSWAVYRLRGTPAALIGIVDAPDEKTAIKKAIEEYKIRNAEQQKRLGARRRA